MRSSRLPRLVALSALVVAGGCASATQPALEVGGEVSYTRAELFDAVAEAQGATEGLPAAVGRDSFNQALNGLVTDGLGAEIAAELDRRDLAPTDADREALGVPADFDPASLDEAQRSQFELQLNLIALERAISSEGGSIDDYIGELFETVRLDPRYGVFDPSFGVVAPPRSGDVVTAESQMLTDAPS